MMSPKVKKFLQSWIINTLAVLIAAFMIKGISFRSPLDLFVASLILGVLNSVIRPVLLLIALPLLIFTLGLFILVINALLLWLVGSMNIGAFHVDGFMSAFWGALIISMVSLFLNALTGTNRVEVRRGQRPPSNNDRGGNGPVIDV
jgi:putative membrane protein